MNAAVFQSQFKAVFLRVLANQERIQKAVDIETTILDAQVVGVPDQVVDTIGPEISRQQFRQKRSFFSFALPTAISATTVEALSPRCLSIISAISVDETIA